MKFGRKGQGKTPEPPEKFPTWLPLVILVLIVAGFLFKTIGNFVSKPFVYTNDWDSWVNQVLSTEDQPFRLLTLFVLPFAFYFGVTTFIMSLVYSSNLGAVRRSIMVICFVISIMMLPSPITFQLYSLFMGLAPVMVVAFFGILLIGFFWIFIMKKGK